MRNWFFLLLACGVCLFILINSLSKNRPEAFFPKIKTERPTVYYVIGEKDCISCVAQLKPFIDLLEEHEHIVDQRLILVSAEQTDRGDYGPMLGLPFSIHTSAAILEATHSQGLGPMMFLLTPSKNLVFARMISGVITAPEALKDEITQLCYQIGGH